MGINFYPGYPVNSHKLKKQNTVSTLGQPQFSGLVPNKKKSSLTLPALFLSILPLISPSLHAAKNVQSLPGSDKEVIYIDPNTSIDDAEQLAPVFQNSTGASFTQRIIDLKVPENLLTDGARQRIYQAIKDCQIINAKNGSCAQFFLSIVGESGYQSADRLATDIGGLASLGRQKTSGVKFDEIINDGFSIAVIKDRLVVNGPEKLGFSEGNGISGVWRKARQRVADAIIPEIETGAALKDTNPRQAQIHFSNAIESAVKILIEEAKQYKAREMREARESYVSPEEQARRDAAFRENLTHTVMALFLTLSLGGAGFTYHQWRRRRQNAVDLVAPALEKMGSSYEVTRNNVFSLNTVEALLENNPQSAELPDAAEILNPLKLIVNELWPHTNKPGQTFEAKLPEQMTTKEQAQVGQLSEILIEKGLEHPLASVRLAAVKTLLTDGFQEAEYTAFVNLLGTEQDYRVIDALVKPVTEHTTVDQVAFFKTRLNQNEPAGTRALSLSILEKFSDENTLGDFYAALTLEKETGLIEKMQDAIARVAKKYPTHPNTKTLLDENLTLQSKVKNRAASLKAYSALGSSKHFQSVYAHFLENTQRRELNLLFKKALTNSLDESHFPTVYSGLESQDERIEDMSLRLLTEHPNTNHVNPLLKYLGTEGIAYPAEAKATLVKSTGETNRKTLLQIVEDYKIGAGNREPMLAALAGLEKLQVDGGLSLIISRFTDIQADDVKDAMYQVMEKAVHSDENFRQLQGTLATSPDKRLRIAAALVLDNYGAKALMPLFTALLKAAGLSQGRDEVGALEEAIAKAGEEAEAFPIFLEFANHLNPIVKNTATEGALTHLEGWERQYDYNDNKVMKALKKLKKNENPKIAHKAKSIIHGFIDDKAQKVRNLGSGSFRRYGSNYQNAEKYANGGYEDKIKRAAQRALDELDSRRHAHEAAERAREEAARAAARSASSSNSGFGGFGGGSMGGGGSL